MTRARLKTQFSLDVRVNSQGGLFLFPWKCESEAFYTKNNNNNNNNNTQKSGTCMYSKTELRSE